MAKNADYQTLDITDAASKAIDGTDFTNGKSYSSSDYGGFKQQAAANPASSYTNSNDANTY